MPGSFPFPVYSGVLEPIHYQQINSAIWLFLWCVSSTTKEVERDGVNWGVVLGNKPVSIDDLKDQFGVSRSTIKRWIESLEEHGYIRTKRAPYGLIFTVRNSKKYENRGFKNEPSSERDGSNLSHPVKRDGSNVVHLPSENEPSNKDITEDLVVVDQHEASRRIKEIEMYYLQRRGKGFAISPNDFLEIQKLVAAGVPSPLIKTCIDRAFDEYRPRHYRDEIRSFNFIVPRILDELEKSKASAAAVPPVAGSNGSDSKHAGYKSKQQRELDELERMREEELKREQASGH